MDQNRASRKRPQIRQRLSPQVTGPIWLGALGGGPRSADSFGLVTFSEVIACEWHCDTEEWLHGDLVIDQSEDAYRFPRSSVRHVHVIAWPCSLSIHDGEEEVGWALDGWDATVVPEGAEDRIRVTIKLAVMGVGTRLNRVGYTWTAYIAGE